MRRFLTFDDVGLVPKFNKIASRLHTNIGVQLGKDIYKTPFIPANMDSVIGPTLAKICKERGAPIIFHRFAPIEQQVAWVKEFPEAYMSLGVQESASNLEKLYEAGCRRFCIDIAHGHSQVVIDAIKKIKDLDKENQVIAGNVCTYDGVMDLAKAGANIIKVGVGPGAACITRMMTGFGIPQFSAIRECSYAKNDIAKIWHNDNIYLIADGGITHPRDAVIALAAGADAVMMGSIFARTYESAAPKNKIGDKTFGRYRGQASSEFMNEYFGDSKKRQAEGVAFDVEINKSAMDVFDEYEGGLRSALTYCGTDSITDFKKNAEIFESTSSFMTESNYRK
jgi:IMP dehydrogenase